MRRERVRPDCRWTQVDWTITPDELRPYLEYPEAQEWEKLVSFVVKAVIFAYS